MGGLPVQWPERQRDTDGRSRSQGLRLDLTSTWSCTPRQTGCLCRPGCRCTGPARSIALAWDIGLTAVIETADGQLSYWALQHPAARPDFHHRGGWQALPEPARPSLHLHPTP